jgi:hypothetical protein
MSLLKTTKDRLIKVLFGKATIPRGLYELDRYFRLHDPIDFEKHEEEGYIVAVSVNFLYGSIIAQGSTESELDRNIKDAILTSFEVPSSYAREAGVQKIGASANRYALA